MCRSNKNGTLRPVAGSSYVKCPLVTAFLWASTIATCGDQQYLVNFVITVNCDHLYQSLGSLDGWLTSSWDNWLILTLASLASSATRNSSIIAALKAFRRLALERKIQLFWVFFGNYNTPSDYIPCSASQARAQLSSELFQTTFLQLWNVYF